MTVEQFQTILANVMGLTWEQITGEKKDTTSVTARQLYCLYCELNFKEKSKSAIARDLKYKTHSSVITSLRRIKNLVDTRDELVWTKIFEIDKNIKGK